MEYQESRLHPQKEFAHYYSRHRSDATLPCLERSAVMSQQCGYSGLVSKTGPRLFFLAYGISQNILRCPATSSKLTVAKRTPHTLLLTVGPGVLSPGPSPPLLPLANSYSSLRSRCTHLPLKSLPESHRALSIPQISAHLPDPSSRLTVLQCHRAPEPPGSIC